MKTSQSEKTNKTQTELNKKPFWRSLVEDWNRFWFTPGDPTLLGLIRVCVGFIALYNTIAYTFDLQTFHGKQAWISQELRHSYIQESPFPVQSLNGPFDTSPKAKPFSDEHVKYIEEYRAKFHADPPPPFPTVEGDPKSIDWEKAQEIDEFRYRWGADPRDPLNAYAKGTPEWSIWLHVNEPTNMMIIHGLFILVAFLFMIGFCTRITSVLAWFAAMCYVQRSPMSLFGVDTMMLILLMYLMLGPSGSAVSVDRWILHWWRTKGGNFLRKWGFLKDDKTELASKKAEIVSSQTILEPPRKTIIANFALRMLQVHVCFVYAAAGLAKLKGTTWWSGQAVWGTLANTEFAPLNSPLYMFFLENLAKNYLFLQIFLTAGTVFTLFFEICYPFFIWSRKTRWLMLSMAVILHGLIGMVMGLKTFAVMMLIMNMAFLPPSAVNWILEKFRRMFALAQPQPPEKKSAPEKPDQEPVLQGSGSEKTVQNHVKSSK